MATETPPPQPESGHVHATIPGLLRRFPLPEPTILNPYRSVIQELTKIPMNHEAPLASNYTFLEG